MHFRGADIRRFTRHHRFPRALVFFALLTTGCVPTVPPTGGPADPVSMTVSASPDTDPPVALAFETVTRYATTIRTNGDPADVYFPDAPATESAERFPVALLLQGFNVDKSLYSEFAATLAAHGFIVVVPNHRGLLGSLLAAELSELTDVPAFLTEENADPASPLFNRVETGTLVLIGHSFGGAAALNAADARCAFPFCLGRFAPPPELAGIVIYGTTWLSPLNPAAIIPVENSAVPIMVVSGELDSVAPAADAAALFTAIESGPRAFVTVSGANHFGMNDVNNPPGTVRDRNDPTVSHTESSQTIATWAALFLGAYARGDPAARDVLRPALDTAAGILVEE